MTKEKMSQKKVKKPLHIAIMSTNLLPTPPLGQKTIYAPLWLTSQLADSLVERGHKVFLFGSSDSKTKGTLISLGLPSMVKNKEWGNAYKKLTEIGKQASTENHGLTWAIKWKEVLREHYELLLASKLFQMANTGAFDIIQFHAPPRVLQFVPFAKTPVVATIHDTFPHPLESYANKIIYGALDKYCSKNLYFISVSNVQRKPLPNINYAATVHHGIDVKKFSFSNQRGEYLAFAGRIVPQKGIHIAMDVAKKTGRKIKIAGSIPPESTYYWEQEIKPRLSANATYEGMLSPKQMISFYQKAEALMMPIMLDESFGLVMVEAMACGTPVIGFKRSTVPELVKHKKTGYVVRDEKEMIAAVKNLDKIKRDDCRKWVEKNFSLESMVENYEKVYYKIIAKIKGNKL
ncbi:glycosyltransferase family 4 protein [Patescibacteria group bacterium]|nr:glycosyltransferase family 4 protein [Patescibacteria group bacterium]